jgi:hypothetical protein
MNPQDPRSPVVTKREPSHASRFTLFLLLAVILMVAMGGAGYYLGWTQGHAPLQQATLRVSVHNALPTNQNVQILVNGKVRDNVVIPTGQTTTLDEQVAFAGFEGAYFAVGAIAASGPHDTVTVLVSSPGTYPIALSLGG